MKISQQSQKFRKIINQIGMYSSGLIEWQQSRKFSEPNVPVTINMCGENGPNPIGP